LNALRPTTLAARLLAYVALYLLPIFVVGPLVIRLTGEVLGLTLMGLAAAILTNSLSMRIFEGRRLVDIGLWWNHAAVRNLVLGLGGGAGSAAFVLCPPLIFGAARLQHVSGAGPTLWEITFSAITVLLFGSAHEEMLFRGYGFQILLRSTGAWATVLPVGIVFAALHAVNPNSTYLALANTAGFGILFGYAFLRSRDLWLPIGLHFGWNFTLPLFGVNVSGLKIGMMGYSMQWSAGALWSGGEYGPEASILTSMVLLGLFAYLWKAPVERQASPLLDPPAGDEICAPGTRE